MLGRRMMAIVAIAGATVLLAGPASAATTTVDETSLGAGWTTGDTRGEGALAFTDVAGRTAVQFSTPSSSDKIQLFTGADFPLEDIGTVDYGTYRYATSNADEVQLPAINLTLDYNGDATGGFVTLVFEPYYTHGIPAEDEWSTWTASGAGEWWSTRVFPGVTCTFSCFVPLDAIIEANPDAVVQAFGINQGTGNAGLLAAVDQLTLAGTTYDFAPRVFSKADCRSGGWATNFDDDQFVNQGDCVSFFASDGKTHGE